jgi:hypothetical protein
MKHTDIARMIPRGVVSVSFAFLLFAPAAASAAECPASSPEDPQERRKLAKEWFSAAETAENGGDDVEATRAYACSYKMVAHPFTAFNLARVSERSGESELSLKMYKAYLTLKPDAQDKESVKGKIKALEEKMASGKEATPPAGETSPTEAAAEGTPPAEPAQNELTPPPEPKPAEVVERVKPAEPEPEPETPSHTLEWIIGGASVAALVGGVATNLVARSKMSTCQANANKGLLADADADCNAARPLAYTSYVLFGVAAAGAVVDATLLILRRSGGDSSSSDDSSVGFLWVPGGGGLTARGRF